MDVWRNSGAITKLQHFAVKHSYLMKRFTRDLSQRIVLMGLLINIDLATSLHRVLPSSKVTELYQLSGLAWR